MYLITFYVPESHSESVKAAMFAAGAGKIGAYACCAWQVKGEGQFMPLVGSQAFVGKVDSLEKIAEYKVEMVCDEDCIDGVIAALKQSHPYETPAFHVMQCDSYVHGT